jgi:hypothetical protein
MSAGSATATREARKERTVVDPAQDVPIVAVAWPRRAE